jgi:alginate O-acetyltransferase complex protein AlgI
MLFSTPIFVFAFLPIVLAVTYALHGAAALLERRGIRTGERLPNLWLTLASLLFYAWGEPAASLLMVASVVWNWGHALAMSRALGPGASRSRGRARALLALCVAGNLGARAGFKYAGFAVECANALRESLGLAAWPGVEIALPVGISFFTFQAMSYAVDVYRGQAEARRNPLDVALYVALFPQLVAGPIVRYLDVAKEIVARTVSVEGFAAGSRRFVIGLGKKMLIANVAARAADRVFELGPGELSAPVAWLGALCYTAQIYFDFSGYSDMAIGMGRMLGFHFKENFLWPYVSGSVTEFWRRWHVSLSTWFRDYLYIPLGGSRRGPARTALNLFVVFLLCGLWHGASFGFVVWGLYHGAFLALERLGLARALGRAPRALRHAYTMLVVIAGWVIFRAESLDQAADLLRAMAGLAPAGAGALHPLALHLDNAVLLALGAAALGSLPWLPALASWRAARPRGAVGFVLDAAGFVLLQLVLVGSAMQLAADSYNPFIYFRF